jgi:hypothetical protein
MGSYCKQCLSCGRFETSKKKSVLPCPYLCVPDREICPSWCRGEQQPLMECSVCGTETTLDNCPDCGKETEPVDRDGV